MSDTLARQRQITGTAGEWAANDRVLGAGELAIEWQGDGSVRARVGDGLAPFSAAPYLTLSAAALRYKGTADPTAAPPAGALTGDAYSASPGGLVAASWGPPAAGQTVVAGAILAKADDGSWHVSGAILDLAPLVTEAELGGPTGAAMVGLNPGGPLSQTITLEHYFRELTISAAQFTGIDWTGATDCSPAIQAAVERAQALGARLWFPKGAVLFKDVIARQALGPLRIAASSETYFTLAAGGTFILGLHSDGSSVEGGRWYGNRAECPTGEVFHLAPDDGQTVVYDLTVRPDRVTDAATALFGIAVQRARVEPGPGGRLWDDFSQDGIMFATGNSEWGGQATRDVTVQGIIVDRSMNTAALVGRCVGFTAYGTPATVEPIENCHILDVAGVMAEAGTGDSSLVFEIWCPGVNCGVRGGSAIGGAIAVSIANYMSEGYADNVFIRRAGFIGAESASSGRTRFTNLRIDCDDLTDTAVSLDYQLAPLATIRGVELDGVRIWKPTSVAIHVIGPPPASGGAGVDAARDAVVRGVTVFAGAAASAALWMQNVDGLRGTDIHWIGDRDAAIPPATGAAFITGENVRNIHLAAMSTVRRGGVGFQFYPSIAGFEVDFVHLDGFGGDWNIGGAQLPLVAAGSFGSQISMRAVTAVPTYGIMLNWSASKLGTADTDWIYESGRTNVATPEGALGAGTGSVIATENGKLWIKATSPTATTGWREVALI